MLGEKPEEQLEGYQMMQAALGMSNVKGMIRSTFSRKPPRFSAGFRPGADGPRAAPSAREGRGAPRGTLADKWGIRCSAQA